MGCRDTLRSLEYGRGDFPPDRYGLDLKTRRLYGSIVTLDGEDFSPKDPITEPSDDEQGMYNHLRNERYLGSMLPFSVSVIGSLGSV